MMREMMLINSATLRCMLASSKTLFCSPLTLMLTVRASGLAILSAATISGPTG
jgi:hypothetical protein